MNTISKMQAILSLVPGAQVTVRGDEVEWINPSVASVTEQQIAAEQVRLQSEYDANEYQRKRVREYPSIADQFDLLYHGGYDAWKAEIDKVKEKYPKP